MGLRINHNIQSINGHRNLQQNDFRIGRSMEKLSSGLQINRAADDAAGLVISEQMRAQIVGLDTAISNSETATNMVQTAEGALDEMNSLLQKARSLALHAANEGANDNAQLIADQDELNNIIDSITRIADNTQFGTKKILDGSLNSFKSNADIIGSTSVGHEYRSGLVDGSIVRGYHTLVVTTEAAQGSLTLANLSGVATGTTTANLTGSSEFTQSFTLSVGGQELSVASGQIVSDVVNNLNALGKEVGFVVDDTVAGGIVLNYQEYGDSFQVDFSYISGASGASEITSTHADGTNVGATLYLNTGAIGATAGTGGANIVTLTGDGLILKSTGDGGYKIETMAAVGTGSYKGVIDGNTAGATFQVGANAGQKVTIDMASMKAIDIGEGVDATYNNLQTLKSGSLTGGDAAIAIEVIDDAINDVTVQRGKLGAFQANTLETGINSLRVTRENLIGAESNIRDVDFAAESANFAKLNIMVQSSTAMLAQANQLPQNVLQLLG